MQIARKTPLAGPSAAPRPRVPSRARHRAEQVLAVAAVVALAGAWLFGYLRSSTQADRYLSEVMPGADHFERDGQFWRGLGRSAGGPEQVVGLAGVAQAPGYSGPDEVLVAVDLQGTVTGVKVISNSDTPSFFHIVAASGFLNQFLGKPFNAPFTIGQDVDAVTGATFTSQGITLALQQAVRSLAAEKLGQAVPVAPTPLQVEAPEITLIVLYLVGGVAHKPSFPFQKWLRWATMLIGLVVLGFWLNRPLTIAHFTSLLAGYWPAWQSNLYWYLLLGGILLVLTSDGKNPYCTWICPFGAAQECLSLVGGTRWRPPRTWAERLTWPQRGLAFTALFFGLALRQPAATSYEVFGTLFKFTGTALQWALLFLVLLASVFIYRPWCDFLCPVRPVVELISAARRWVRDLWLKLKNRPTGRHGLPT